MISVPFRLPAGLVPAVLAGLLGTLFMMFAPAMGLMGMPTVYWWGWPAQFVLLAVGVVAGLVLACCTPAFGASAGAMQQAFLDKRLGPLDEGASMRELAIDLIPGMVGPGGEAELVHDAVNLMEQIPPDSYRRALRAVVGFDQRSALARIAVPALVIAGTHDKVSTPQVVRRMAERLPAGVYREIDAGHLAPFEEPAIFTALVREFLDGLDHIPVI